VREFAAIVGGEYYTLARALQVEPMPAPVVPRGRLCARCQRAGRPCAGTLSPAPPQRHRRAPLR